MKNIKWSSFLISGLLINCGGTLDVSIPSPEKDDSEQVEDKIVPSLKHLDASKWELVPELSDEFEQSDFDLAKWVNDPSDWGPWSWKPENTGIEDGRLKITMDYEPHQTQRRAWKDGGKWVDVDLFYTSGILRSKQTQIYGYYEARIKGVPTFPGSSPAFWIYSIGQEQAGMAEGAIKYSEVDIVELTQSEWAGIPNVFHGPEVIDMNLHTRIVENGEVVWKRPGGYPELTKNEIHADFDPRDDFHIYGAEVTPEYVTWYLDGEQVAQKVNHHWHLPMHVTLSLGLRRPHVTYNNCPDGLDRCVVPSAATADGYPTDMLVDWVRVYKKLD